MPESWYVQACRTWLQVLDEAVALHGDRELFVYKDRHVTYAEFDRLSSDLAKGLIEIGVKPKDVVAIWMTNSLDWVVCQFAIYKTGAILLPIYSYYREAELDHAIRQAGVKTLIMSDNFLGKIDAVGIFAGLVPEAETVAAAEFGSERFPTLESVIVVDETRPLPSRFHYDAVMEAGRSSKHDEELLRRQMRISPFDVMNIMYTSGTTGFPKGGMSMHVTNLSTVIHWSAIAELTPDDTILCHVPLFTNLGALYVACLAIYNGSRVIITEQFDAANSLRLIETEKVTYIPGTPSVFRLLLDHEDIAKTDLSSVRGGHVAGAPLTEKAMTEIIEVLGCREVMQAWGLSECGGLSTVTSKHDTLERRLKTVGKPLPNARVKIVDTETGQDAPTGQPGEIYLHDVHPGSCVGAGYYGMPEQTAKTINAEGFFKTGDTGYFDEEGYLYLSGRVDDMFTVGGFNIYPAEIENQIDQIEGISEAYVVSMEDRRLGRVPVAWVMLDATASLTEGEIISLCKSKLSSQKVPRRVFFYQPGELPMTAGGKIKKKDLTLLTEKLVAEISLQPQGA